MRKKTAVFITFFILYSIAGYSQTSSGKGSNSNGTSGKKRGNSHIKWKVQPFDHQVFIENKGQFDGIIPGNEKILYGAQLGDVWAYFTSHGIVYRYSETPKIVESTKGQDPDKDGPPKPVIHYMSSNWEGANAAAVIAKEERSDYYTYPNAAGGTIKTNIYNKIIYRDIYPGIDIEYIFPKGKPGLKYSIIVHPGANVSKAMLKYATVSGMKLNNNGDVVFNSPVGAFTDHSPVAKYSGDNGNVDVSYKVIGSTESFNVNENYDKNKTLVIDPWVTDPLFNPPYDRAYDVDYDYRGNVYVCGSWSNLQAEKFNSAGVPQWTYNITQFPYSYYGDIVVNRTSGTVYLTEGFNSGGARVIKLWNNGSYQGISTGVPSLDEMWRAIYDPCNDTIILGAGGTNAPEQACLLDTNLGSPTPVNVLGAVDAFHDMVLIATDPSGSTCYMATALSSGDGAAFDNVVLKLPVHTLIPTAYLTPDNFGFQESNVPSYVGTGSYTANGYDGMAASPNWLYVYNSVTLNRLNKATGAQVSGIPISNAVLNQGKPSWGGLAVDNCDDIFVGCHDSVKLYNPSMVLDSSITLPNTVYDLVLGQNNLLYASGQSFVCAVEVPPPPSLISSVSGAPSSCSACDGKATVAINCGIAPFKYHWSNGNTNQTDTGMCAGIYSVKVTDGACPPRIDSATVIISGKAGYTASVKDTSPNCGTYNITAYPTGGDSPYTYLWSNGQTNQTDIGVGAGTYTCTITDKMGCKTFVSITLVNPEAPTVSVIPVLDSVCPGTGIGLTASGASIYKWSPSLGLSCNNCANPTASPTVTTTYTVTGIDSVGCKDTATTTIKVRSGAQPVITGPDSVCVGTGVTLNATGGNSYVWTPGNTTNSSIFFIASANQTYTLSASNGTCTGDTTFKLTVVPDPTTSIQASKDSVCSGDSLTLTGGTGVKFKWLPGGQTTSTIHVRPTNTTTYTFYSYAGTCRDSASITIPIIPVITASIRTTVDSICPLEPATLTATGIGGQATYSWSPGGETTDTITVSPDSTTTYTATVNGLCNSVQKTIKVTFVPLPNPVISGTPWKCRGVRDTLTVSNSNGPVTYVWSDGKTGTSIHTGNIYADSTVSVTAYNKLGCSHDTTFSITLRYPDVVSISAPVIFCAGQQVIIGASATGTPSAYSYSWSPGGQTTDSITISPEDTTVYAVTVSNGCIATKSILVTPNYPNLYSCCNQTLTMVNDTVTPSSVILMASGNSVKYQWTDSSNIVCLNPPLCDSVKVIPSPSVTTTYTVTGTDQQGCQISQLITINIDIPCFSLTLPNVFTPTLPGPDGVNSEFYIKTDNVDAWSITIFDRWGKEVFQTTDQYKYWNGNTESGGQAPAGVYYYIINATCQNTTYKKDGFLQLIR